MTETDVVQRVETDSSECFLPFSQIRVLYVSLSLRVNGRKDDIQMTLLAHSDCVILRHKHNSISIIYCDLGWDLSGTNASMWLFVLRISVHKMYQIYIYIYKYSLLIANVVLRMFALFEWGVVVSKIYTLSQQSATEMSNNSSTLMCSHDDGAKEHQSIHHSELCHLTLSLQDTFV